MTHDAAKTEGLSAEAVEAAGQAAVAPRRLGLKKNFAWALTGNFIYQGSQWLNLVLLAKFTSVADVGRFALALAICTPITAFAALNLQLAQITDTRDEYRFGHFLAVRLLTSTLGLLVIAGIALLGNYDATTGWLILIVGAGQLVVVLREVFISYSQKHERMDTVALSKSILGFASLATLGLLVWQTGNVLLAVAGMQGAKLAVFLLWDLRATGRLVRERTAEAPRQFFRPIWEMRMLGGLVWLALPLGISMMLLNLSKVVPNYYIATFLDKEQLGYFAPMVALAMAGSQVIKAASGSALPRMSRYYLTNRQAYCRLLLRLVAFGVVFGAAGLVVVTLVGGPLLAIMFTPEYADYSDVFWWIMVYAMLCYVVDFVRSGMTAMRWFKIQPIGNLAAMIAVAVSGWWLIPAYGLVGGAFSLMLGQVVYGMVAVTVVVLGFRRPLAEVVPLPVEAGQALPRLAEAKE